MENNKNRHWRWALLFHCILNESTYLCCMIHFVVYCYTNVRQLAFTYLAKRSFEISCPWHRFRIIDALQVLHQNISIYQMSNHSKLKYLWCYPINKYYILFYLAMCIVVSFVDLILIQPLFNCCDVWSFGIPFIQKS